MRPTVDEWTCCILVTNFCSVMHCSSPSPSPRLSGRNGSNPTSQWYKIIFILNLYQKLMALGVQPAQVGINMKKWYPTSIQHTISENILSDKISLIPIDETRYWDLILFLWQTEQISDYPISHIKGILPCVQTVLFGSSLMSCHGSPVLMLMSDFRDWISLTTLIQYPT